MRKLIKGFDMPAEQKHIWARWVIGLIFGSVGILGIAAISGTYVQKLETQQISLDKQQELIQKLFVENENNRQSFLDELKEDRKVWTDKYEALNTLVMNERIARMEADSELKEEDHKTAMLLKEDVAIKRSIYQSLSTIQQTIEKVDSRTEKNTTSIAQQNSELTEIRTRIESWEPADG